MAMKQSCVAAAALLLASCGRGATPPPGPAAGDKGGPGAAGSEFTVPEPTTAGERWIVERFAGAVDACVSGEQAACRRLSQRCQYATNDAEIARYGRALAQACNGGKGPAVACGGYGLALILGAGVAADATRGLALLEKGCDRGDDISCARLATLVARGEHEQTKGKDAEAIARGACERFSGWACYVVATIEDGKENF